MTLTTAELFEKLWLLHSPPAGWLHRRRSCIHECRMQRNQPKDVVSIHSFQGELCATAIDMVWSARCKTALGWLNCTIPRVHGYPWSTWRLLEGDILEWWNRNSAIVGSVFPRNFRRTKTQRETYAISLVLVFAKLSSSLLRVRVFRWRWAREQTNRLRKYNRVSVSLSAVTPCVRWRTVRQRCFAQLWTCRIIYQCFDARGVACHGPLDADI